MARIKIRDLPKGVKVSAEELKAVRGGLDVCYSGSLSTANVSTLPMTHTGEDRQRAVQELLREANLCRRMLRREHSQE